mgnify:CR=1 FL=1
MAEGVGHANVQAPWSGGGADGGGGRLRWCHVFWLMVDGGGGSGYGEGSGRGNGEEAGEHMCQGASCPHPILVRS